MSGLAHYFEAAGIPTTLISLVRVHTEKMRPPRALWVPFELGRPFGPPGDAAFQTHVLEHALGLLEAASGPLLVDYPEEATASTDEDGGWVCPVQFHAPTVEAVGSGLAQSVRNEVHRLATWYDRALSLRERTTVGVSGLDIAEIVSLLLAPLSDAAEGEGAAPAYSADAIRLAAEDLKAYYTEAATAQPGVASSDELQRWFWRETAASALLRALQARFADTEDPALRLLSELLLVPRAQA